MNISDALPMKEAWSTAQNAKDKREKIQALSLAKDCYSMKLDLLTNATVVDDAMKFASGHSNQKASTMEEKKQKEEAIDVNQVTKNQVF